MSWFGTGHGLIRLAEIAKRKARLFAEGESLVAGKKHREAMKALDEVDAKLKAGSDREVELYKERRDILDRLGFREGGPEVDTAATLASATLGMFNVQAAFALSGGIVGMGDGDDGAAQFYKDNIAGLDDINEKLEEGGVWGP